jgi:hypothetical protein
VQGCVDSRESLTGVDRPELSGTTKEVTERNNTDHILDKLINWQYLLPPIKLFYRRFAINLPIEIQYSPPFTRAARVWAFSCEFCQELAKFIWASKWASLGREGVAEPHTHEGECYLQMGIASIKKSKKCLITYPVVLVV